MKSNDSLDLLNENEKQELLLIQQIRNNIKRVIGIENIITKISSLIDSSNYFSFNTERNRKYVSRTKPIFILKIDKTKLAKDYKGIQFIKNIQKDDFFINGHSNPKYHKDIELIQEIISEKIIHPFNEYIMDFVYNSDKFNEMIKDNLGKEVTFTEKDKQLVAMTVSVMFAIKVNLKDERIYLEYAV